MALAEVVQEAQEPCNEVLTPETMPNISSRHEDLRQRTKDSLIQQGVEEAAIQFEVYLNLRYRGSDTTLMILEPQDKDWKKGFISEHLREFSFVLPEDREILVDDIRVRAIGVSSESTKDCDALAEELGTPFEVVDGKIATEKVSLVPGISSTRADSSKRPIYFKNGGYHDASVFLLKDLRRGNLVIGPAVIIDNTQTIVVSPGCEARALSNHIIIDVKAQQISKADALTVDPIQLSVFAHRFMSIAEQMGRALQKTCVSLNIKERLDFACAIFGPNGDLVANAPHVPVFLGSMSYAVKGQIELVGDKMRPGDVFVTNHPSKWSSPSSFPNINCANRL